MVTQKMWHPQGVPHCPRLPLTHGTQKKIANSLIGITALCEELLAALLADRLPIESLQVRKGSRNGLSGKGNCRLWVPVGPPGWLRNYGIDHPKSHHVLGGDFHAGRCFLGLGRVAP